MDKLWILTEEKPKTSVVLQIVTAYCQDFGDSIVEKRDIRIRPVFKNNVFQFRYEVEGLKVSKADGIIIKTVSGSSSFLDFLLFRQECQPSEAGGDIPLMAIEETKTSDDESRNTGVYQRGSKFVFIDAYYPGVKLYMLYNEELCARESKKPSDTSIFGTNILLTLGVKILGKEIAHWFKPFKSVDDLIRFKSLMRKPPAGNVPIEIVKTCNSISVSGRLAKPADAGNIGHDPNIGALAMISKCIRSLGWQEEIVITQHGVDQSYINSTRGRNKFLYICNLLGLTMEGLSLPSKVVLPDQYWHYEMSSEKMASILLHVQGEYVGLKEVYQNHAGCERGYFKNKSGRLITLPKKDTHGVNLYLPDLVMWDENTNTIVLIEGKKLDTLKAGLEEIEYYDSIENEYIRPNFPNCTIKRGVSIFGGCLRAIPAKGVLFYLNEYGEVRVSEDAPNCIKKAFSGL